MENNVKELLDLIENNPDLPILPMVDGDVCGGDEYSRWLGRFGACRVVEYIIDEWYGEGCIRFKDDGDIEDIIEGIAELEYGDCTDDENWEKAKNLLDSMWQKAIVINIDTP